MKELQHDIVHLNITKIKKTDKKSPAIGKWQTVPNVS